ncbi:putative MFS transporter [Aspergillus saccharolyticus JOP 1030-1]|uniref:Putative MFS transporter n=1 Tax=Aspergillus saccharolyticus JOP 1030-1 TaxID=1450539 RepID=A0A318ZFI4_9EURO|nr:putative MFS transporter [Aspergillus saccharolyticus JOP 1030-1]PYH45457.1 putative MFS transporter [Aspergillus saccharolyticus JOP 1030-1]
MLSYCAFLAPMSSTAIDTAVADLAKTFDTTQDIIYASSSLYLGCMGISALIWGPASQVWGRRPLLITSSFLFFAFTVASTFATNLVSYFIFRGCAALQGTSFLVIGNAIVGDLYEPTARASALGWVLSGSLTGPALGPFLGGIIITYRPWRTIFYLLSALSLLATILITILLPETIPQRTLPSSLHHDRSLRPQIRQLWQQISPLRILHLIISYPNILSTGLAAGALVWNEYALLTPIRQMLNPRFHLTSPIEAGLLYLPCGLGYLAGTFFGGHYTDRVARYYIRRGGRRIPEDRLRACLPFICLASPACILVYGWTVAASVGGIALPVVVMFLQGVAQIFCFPSLNTYCLDVMQEQGRSAEVVGANYAFRYVFAALGTGVAMPAVKVIGVGWFNTISAVFLIAAGALVWWTAVSGEAWREAVDLRRSRRQGQAGREKVSMGHVDGGVQPGV